MNVNKEHVYLYKFVKPGEQMLLLCAVCNCPVRYAK